MVMFPYLGTEFMVQSSCGTNSRLVSLTRQTKEALRPISIGRRGGTQSGHVVTSRVALIMLPHLGKYRKTKAENDILPLFVAQVQELDYCKKEEKID